MRVFLPIAIVFLTACGAPLRQSVTTDSSRATSTRKSDESGNVRSSSAQSDEQSATQEAPSTRRSKRRIKPFHISLRRGKTRIDNLRLIRVDPKDPERMWIDKTARKRIKKLLGDKRHKRHKRIPERLLWNLYFVAQHFDAPLEVVSGYRSRERRTSRHRHMRAVDFRIRGVNPHTIWTWAKRFNHVGLGWYPTSKFVHLDVREKSAYWIDDSGPGQRARYRKKVPQTRAKTRRRIN